MEKRKVVWIISFASGLAVGFVLLFLWGQFTSSVGAVGFSFLSSNGAQIAILGMRIKHWMVGLGLFICGSVVAVFRHASGLFLMGLGVALMIDEVNEFL
jgi:hypothetical protein